MNCKDCEKTLKNGKYICSTDDYRIIDKSNNLVFIHETHTIPSDNVEIGDNTNVKYCSCGYYIYV